MRPLLSVSCLTLTLAVAGCDFDFPDHGDSHRFQENFNQSYPLKPGGRLSVENFNGSVEVFGWDKDTVEVSGTKYASTEDLLKSIRVDIQASPDAVRIRTDRPVMRGNYGARFTIYVPRKIEIERIGSSNGSIRLEDVGGPARLRTSNGTIRVSRVGGNLEAQTTNGRIELANVKGSVIMRTSNGSVRGDDLQGNVETTTTNGSITLAMDQPREVRASTTNGSIIVRLPDNAGATVQANTSNSTVNSDFDIRGRVAKNRVDGVIGSGGPLLDLETTNGSIRLAKR